MKTIHASQQAQELYDLTSALLPARRAWIQAADLAMGVREASTSLTVILLMAGRLGPDVSQKTLAREIGINAAAVAHLLDQGEAGGLLRRDEVPGDRRRKAINLSPKGEEIVQELEVRLAALRHELLGDLPAEDVANAVRVLRLLEERSLDYVQGRKAE